MVVAAELEDGCDRPVPCAGSPGRPTIPTSGVTRAASARSAPAAKRLRCSSLSVATCLSGEVGSVIPESPLMRPLRALGALLGAVLVLAGFLLAVTSTATAQQALPPRVTDYSNYP